MYLVVIYLLIWTTMIFYGFSKNIGIKGVKIINSIVLIIINIVIYIYIYEIIYMDSKIEIEIYKWLEAGIIGVEVGFIYDRVSVIILYLIITIFSIVINYSLWYMEEDAHIIRFIIYMYIFSIMMIILVISKNIIIMLIGWEGVGISSYLLINFWYNRIQANKSSIKALLYNKVGDIFFIFSIIIYIIYYNNSSIITFNNNYLMNENININNIIMTGFIIAGVAKSAQIILHCWLGDAMEGPTPVSALLHAATMVTAGIYLIIRILPINILTISNSSYIYDIMVYIGIFTVILGGLISVYQNDMKKIIAFSTCSQLGYMFYSNSLGLYSMSYFHLIIHGYFKALLFLTAGIIIHNFNNIQDIRKYGSLLLFLPISYILFFIGTITIISLPWYSGYYSKDLLLLNSYTSNIYIYIMINIGVLLTTIYSIRLIYLLFFNKPKKKYYALNNYHNLSNNSFFNYNREPFFIWWSLSYLIIGSLFLGFIFKDFFFFLLNSISSVPFFSFSSITLSESPFFNHFIHFIPLLTTLFGVIIGITLDKFLKLFNPFIFIYFNSFFIKKFFFDYLINYFFILFNSKFSFSIFFKNFDRGILDTFGAIGLYRLFFSLLSIHSLYPTLYRYNSSKVGIPYLYLYIIYLFFTAAILLGLYILIA